MISRVQDLLKNDVFLFNNLKICHSKFKQNILNLNKFKMGLKKYTLLHISSIFQRKSNDLNFLTIKILFVHI